MKALPCGYVPKYATNMGGGGVDQKILRNHQATSSSPLFWEKLPFLSLWGRCRNIDHPGGFPSIWFPFEPNPKSGTLRLEKKKKKKKKKKRLLAPSSRELKACLPGLLFLAMYENPGESKSKPEPSHLDKPPRSSGFGCLRPVSSL